MSLRVVKKDSRELPNEFYLVFDFVDNDLAGLIRGVNKGLLPPCVPIQSVTVDYHRKCSNPTFTRSFRCWISFTEIASFTVT